MTHLLKQQHKQLFYDLQAKFVYSESRYILFLAVFRTACTCDTSTGRLSLRKSTGASQPHIPVPEGPYMLSSPALWQKTSLSGTSIACGYGIRRFPIPQNSSRPNVNNRQVRVYRRSRQELLPCQPHRSFSTGCAAISDGERTLIRFLYSNGFYLRVIYEIRLQPHCAAPGF